MNITTWLLVLIATLQAGALFWLWRRLDLLDAERRVEAAALDHLQKQLSHLQRNVQDVALLAQQPAPAARTTPSVPMHGRDGNSPYNQAIELFKRGFAAGDVAERCGISRSEAELILSLYRNSPTS